MPIDDDNPTQAIIVSLLSIGLLGFVAYFVWKYQLVHDWFTGCIAFGIFVGYVVISMIVVPMTQDSDFKTAGKTIEEARHATRIAVAFLVFLPGHMLGQIVLWYWGRALGGVKRDE